MHELMHEFMTKCVPNSNYYIFLYTHKYRTDTRYRQLPLSQVWVSDRKKKNGIRTTLKEVLQKRFKKIKYIRTEQVFNICTKKVFAIRDPNLIFVISFLLVIPNRIWLPGFIFIYLFFFNAFQIIPKPSPFTTAP